MKITNLTAVPKFLGFIAGRSRGPIQDVSAHGVNLPASGSIIVDDSFRSHPSLERMIADGIVSVGSLSVSDADSEYVSSSEFHSFVRGIYRIDDTWGKTGALANSTQADLISSKGGVFDLNSRRKLRIKFDGLVTVDLEFSAGNTALASVLSQMNANVEFAKYAVASTEATEFKIRTLSRGVNANVEILDVSGNCADILGLDSTATFVAGTGTVVTVTIETFNSSGEGVAGILHAVKLYDADLPALVVDVEHQIQRVQTGSIISGINSEEAVLETGDAGVLVFEVSRVVNGATPPFVGILVPATHFLASHPAARIDLS